MTTDSTPPLDPLAASNLTPAEATRRWCYAFDHYDGDDRMTAIRNAQASVNEHIVGEPLGVIELISLLEPGMRAKIRGRIQA